MDKAKMDEAKVDKAKMDETIMDETKVVDAVREYQDAKKRVMSAKSQLEPIVKECSNMTVREAYQLGLIKLTYPTIPGLRRALMEK